jgi:Protein of unknown function (DUF3891)
MLFRERLPVGAVHAAAVLAISQPTHAWISGQLLRAWAEKLDEPLLLAAEQHDLGWLDWETAPSFDWRTGRPHLFRDVGAAVHAPMWARGVERALAAWGARVALLISRHGGLIYARYIDRQRMSEADAAAADRYGETQAPLQATWARALGLDADTLARDTALVALSDTLSLALCGALKVPLNIEAPDRTGSGMRRLRLTAAWPGDPAEFTLSPWPFHGEAPLVVEGEARPVPEEGRFADEAAMRAWLAAPERVVFRARVAPG